jgi:ligand-binding SRPBCC domain-containing protein
LGKADRLKSQGYSWDSFLKEPATVETEVFIPKPLKEVAKFFFEPKNLEKLNSFFVSASVSSSAKTQKNSSFDVNVKLLKILPFTWSVTVVAEKFPHGFVDEGTFPLNPFVYWYHQHLLTEGNGGTIASDRMFFETKISILNPIMKVTFYNFLKQRNKIIPSLI